MAFIIFLQNSFGQTYEAKYKCIFESSWPVKDTSANSQKFEIPFRIITIYTIITDGRYLKATTKIEETSSAFGNGVNFNSSDTQVIFDLKKRLAYFPENKKVKKIKDYYLTKDSTSSGSYKIDGFGNKYIIELGSNLKNFIAPAVFFSNAPNGIRKISTSDFTIELMGPIKQIKKKISYDSYFKTIDIGKIKEEYSFF